MRCAVLGDPVAHSLSPTLHRAAYAEVGLDWTYDAIRVPSGDLATFVRDLDQDWRGLSVTAPLKREALGLADDVSDWARLSGGANTLVLTDGQRYADNTDIPGAVAALREVMSEPPVVATILGGGATAASTALALCELGVGSLTLLVRSPARAADTLAAIDAHPARPAVRVGNLDHDPVVGDLVVSTVPASAQTPELVARCAEAPRIFDVLYDPWPTPLAAAADGRVLVTGLDLLLHQAAAQFELFTGHSAPVAVMRRAGGAALAERQGERA